VGADSGKRELTCMKTAKRAGASYVTLCSSTRAIKQACLLVLACIGQNEHDALKQREGRERREVGIMRLARPWDASGAIPHRRVTKVDGQNTLAAVVKADVVFSTAAT
jgi:hypothetical protein